MIITELGLSQRTEHALRRNGIHSTEQLTQMGDAQILRLRGMGPAMLREIREKLARPERSDAEELAAYRATGLTPEEISVVRNKPVSNADHIRSMSDEDLAEFMRSMMDCVSCENTFSFKCDGNYNHCLPVCLKWLKQPAGEDKNGV